MENCCGNTNSDKLEKINKRALQIVYKDYTANYHELLGKQNKPTLQISRLRILMVEVLKCIKEENVPFLNDLFEMKNCDYSLRRPTRVNQPQKNTTNYGLRSLSYVGSKLWNDFSYPVYDIHSIDLSTFKKLLADWDGPDCNTVHISYV